MSLQQRTGAQMVGRPFQFGGFLPFLAGILGAVGTVAKVVSTVQGIASVFQGGGGPPAAAPLVQAPSPVTTPASVLEDEFADAGEFDEFELELALLELEEEPLQAQIIPTPPAPLLTIPQLRTMPAFMVPQDVRVRVGRREML